MRDECTNTAVVRTAFETGNTARRWESLRRYTDTYVRTLLLTAVTHRRTHENTQCVSQRRSSAPRSQQRRWISINTVQRSYTTNRCCWPRRIVTVKVQSNFPANIYFSKESISDFWLYRRTGYTVSNTTCKLHPTPQWLPCHHETAWAQVADEADGMLIWLSWISSRGHATRGGPTA